MRCNPAYLQGALRAVEARHGSVLGYLDEVLRIDADGVTPCGNVCWSPQSSLRVPQEMTTRSSVRVNLAQRPPPW